MQPSRTCGAVDSFFTQTRQASRTPANTRTPKVSSFAFGSGVPPFGESPRAPFRLRSFLAADKPKQKDQPTKDAWLSDQGP
ncbi:MAG: hypothetical protein DMF92_01505 [Acidobacteria bacterium]|nr:MAG: hypothetical protein DMF92_01505 [Acidobacteriota bacterium]